MNISGQEWAKPAYCTGICKRNSEKQNTGNCYKTGSYGCFFSNDSYGSPDDREDGIKK